MKITAQKEDPPNDDLDLERRQTTGQNQPSRTGGLKAICTAIKSDKFDPAESFMTEAMKGLKGQNEM